MTNLSPAEIDSFNTPESAQARIFEELSSGNIPSANDVRRTVTREKDRIKNEELLAARAARRSKQRKPSAAQREETERRQQMWAQLDAQRDAAAKSAIEIILEKMDVKSACALADLRREAEYHFRWGDLKAAAEAKSTADGNSAKSSKAASAS